MFKWLKKTAWRPSQATARAAQKVLRGYQEVGLNDGVPFVGLDDLLDSQADLIRLTQVDCGLPDISANGNRVSFETLYLSVIRQLASYIHLLPASEYHHHAYPAGLLRHSLEVALGSLRVAQQSVLPARAQLDVEQKRRPRWQYAAWLCGLFHDSGKVMYDLVVYCDKSHERWNPHIADIFEWKKSHDVERYRVMWREDGRHKKHESLSLQLFEKLITQEAREYLVDSDDDVFVAISDAITTTDGHDESNYLLNCVTLADRESAASDLKKNWHPMMGEHRKSLEGQFVEAIRALRSRWAINGKNAAVWVVGPGRVFLNYNQVMGQVVQHLKEHNIPTPKEASVLFDLLEQRNIVVRASKQSTYSILYPFFEAHDGNGIMVFELSWAGILFEDVPAPKSIPGILRLNNEGESVEYRADGTFHEFVEKERPKLADRAKPDQEPPSSNASSRHDAAPPPTTTTTDNAKTKTSQALPEAGAVGTKKPPSPTPSKGIVFANDPKSEPASQAKPKGSARPSSSSAATTQPPKTQAKRRQAQPKPKRQTSPPQPGASTVARANPQFAPVKALMSTESVTPDRWRGRAIDDAVRVSQKMLIKLVAQGDRVERSPSASKVFLNQYRLCLPIDVIKRMQFAVRDIALELKADQMLDDTELEGGRLAVSFEHNDGAIQALVFNRDASAALFTELNAPPWAFKTPEASQHGRRESVTCYTGNARVDAFLTFILREQDSGSFPVLKPKGWILSAPLVTAASRFEASDTPQLINKSPDPLTKQLINVLSDYDFLAVEVVAGDNWIMLDLQKMGVV